MAANLMSAFLMQETEEVVEGRKVRIGERPITFERFLDIAGEDDDFELSKGVLIPGKSARYPHERLFGWLHAVLLTYVTRKRLGVVLGSRTAVEIDAYGGRIPDLLFVSREREHIIHDRAIYGAPDLVIEIASPSNTRSELVELEADYSSIGVSEIVLWYPEPARMVVLRKQGEAYSSETITEGRFHSTAVPGFSVDIGALSLSELPDPLNTVESLLADSQEGRVAP